MSSHSRQVRGYAYIYHDKDDSEKHFHVVLRTFDAWTPEQVAKWFGLCKDDKEEYVNTFNEPVSDLTAICNYLTHKDVDSIKAGKHQYYEKEIIDRNLLRTIEKKEACDHSFAILLALEKGSSLRDLLRIYGKELLYHYRQYKEFLEDMHQQEQRQYFNDGVIPLNGEAKYHWYELAPDEELPF